MRLDQMTSIIDLTEEALRKTRLIRWALSGRFRDLSMGDEESLYYSMDLDVLMEEFANLESLLASAPGLKNMLHEDNGIPF